MPRVWTIVGAAVLLFVAWITVAAIASYFGGHLVPDGAVPDSWSPPNSWATWRDIMIVLSGFFWFLAGVFLCVLLGALVFLVMLVRRILRENVVPAIDSAKEALDNVKGTTEFAGETVVTPIIRVYSVVNGVRSGIGAVGGLADRVRRRKGK